MYFMRLKICSYACTHWALLISIYSNSWSTRRGSSRQTAIQKTVLQTHEWGEPATMLSLNPLAWTQIKPPYTGNFTKEFEHL